MIKNVQKPLAQIVLIPQGLTAAAAAAAAAAAKAATIQHKICGSCTTKLMIQMSEWMLSWK